MRFFQRVFLWLAAIFRWLRDDPGCIWLRWCAGGIALALLIAWEGALHLACDPKHFVDAVLRWLAMMLQTLGLAAVALGIRETRRLFDRQSFLAGVNRSIAAFPRLYPPPVVVSIGAAYIIAGSPRVRMRGRLFSTAHTLETRVANLERFSEDQIEKVDQALRQEKEARQSAIQ